MKKFFLAAALLSLSTFVAAQWAERRPGELLVKLQGDHDLPGVLDWFRQTTGLTVTLKQPVAERWRIYLLQFEEEPSNATRLLHAARRHPGLQAAQWNHRATERAIPNDQDWFRQDDMVLIGAPAAWDASTGGLTPAGDTIVVAVLEIGGANLLHPDLIDNMWFNRGEIPANGLDDDANGYVDDYRGWDPRQSTDAITTGMSHGTGVNGIIGARGNNAAGVAGVNWNVKLLNVSHTEFESEIIAGYEYVAAMRTLYNQTQGAKGAFVVATNASFGLDEVMASEHPVWCGLYDQLGQAGVLSACATVNKNLNVDVVGDMPTTCPSEYMVAVTNVSPGDTKVASAGYGPTSIDLGAPGNDTYTTASPSGYGTLGGTSAATPHVSGSIGLLYSMGCTHLTSDALTNPAQCARRVRDVLLGHVAPNPTLQSVTTTGGRLDLSLAVAAVRDLCEGTVGPLSIKAIQGASDRSRVQVLFETPDFEPYVFRVFNMLGQLMHEETVTPSNFSAKELEFDAAYWPAGIYVAVLTRGKAVASLKFRKI